MTDVVVGHADPQIRERLRSGLEADGCRVRDAATAAGVMAESRRAAPDVVLIDPDLCRHEQVSVLTQLKQDADLYSVAVVLLVAEGSPPDALRGLDEGAQDLILTPLRDGDAVARVRAAARTKALQEEFFKRGRVLEDLVYGDALTGLYNRRFILNQLATVIASARRHDRDLSIVVLDVDHFKTINDELGHAAGDAALVEIAIRLRRRIRREDYVGRLGGEELLVLLPDTGPREAARVAEDLRAAVGDSPMVLEGTSRTVTVSGGWATWSGDSAGDMLRRADDAMYRAKAAGRNRISGCGFLPAGYRRSTAMNAASDADASIAAASSPVS